MKIHSGLDTLKALHPVVTIGMFDGLHLGHRHLIEQLVALAQRHGGESVLISFWPHPRKVLGYDADHLRFLTTLEEKTTMLSEMGIDHVVLLPFTQQLADYTAEEFIEKILVRAIGIHHLLMGFNHRFGKGARHDWPDFMRLAAKYGFEISREEPLFINGHPCSSSLIRTMLDEGNLTEANRLLGYDYAIRGRVIGGNRLGRTIGYPTANIETEDPEKLIPLNGVYACRVHTEGKNYLGMVNIGYRPTLHSTPEKRNIEVHILDFNHDIYSETITITIQRRIRSEIKFESLQALQLQIKHDEEQIRNFFKHNA